MIAIGILVLFIFLLVITPWRRLTISGRLWASAACFNTVVFFSMPTTPATSPWRPVVGGVLAASAGLSLVLALLGLVFRRGKAVEPEARAALRAPLIIGALPAAFYIFFWLIGPLY